MKTFSAKPHEVKRDWFVIDASNQFVIPGIIDCHSHIAAEKRAR
jgi:imidazolonepropionase-like amidohydrolase